MRQSKEQILVELTKIKQSHEEWVSGDERRRREFAKAFNWGQSGSYFNGNTKDKSCPSWPEIFVEVGRLLETRSEIEKQIRIEHLESENSRMRFELETKK